MLHMDQATRCSLGLILHEKKGFSIEQVSLLRQLQPAPWLCMWYLPKRILLGKRQQRESEQRAAATVVTAVTAFSRPQARCWVTAGVRGHLQQPQNPARAPVIKAGSPTKDSCRRCCQKDARAAPPAAKAPQQLHHWPCTGDAPWGDTNGPKSSGGTGLFPRSLDASSPRPRRATRPQLSSSSSPEQHELF
ncbi:hypothetical protein Anapl_03612 [Anas platyrhynchos]|uniref:Uncharacterized protein n=1 Tax=Anas platyrhynchos TaxID=8839 RepID=R0KC26_ANAPL|nr:hypothetical protein Anapl_03612 [Anas platyrhynchos]